MRFVLIFLLGSMTGGCALTTEQIDVPYQPASASVTVVPGAVASLVKIDAIDGRTSYRDRVASKKNGFGMEMGAITDKDDVPTTVGDAIRQELTERGFKIGPGGNDITVEVVKFYSDFKPGMFTADAVADVAFNIKVTAPNSAILFTKYYDGSGTEPNVMLMGGSNARAALIAALRNAVASVVNDPTFIKAIMAPLAPTPSANAVSPATS